MLDLTKTIARMTRLLCLHLAYGYLEDDHISALFPICSQLQELGLLGEKRAANNPRFGLISQLSNESIVFIANNCQDLKVLNISDNEKLTSKGVKKLINVCYKLQTITVHFTSVYLNELKKRPNRFPSLEVIKTVWGHSYNPIYRVWGTCCLC